LVKTFNTKPPKGRNAPAPQFKRKNPFVWESPFFYKKKGGTEIPPVGINLERLISLIKSLVRTPNNPVPKAQMGTPIRLNCLGTPYLTKV